MPNEIHDELLRLIALNNVERWVPHHIAFQQLLDGHGDRLMPGLIECLGDDDAEVRQLAVGLLDAAGQRAEPAVSDLIELLTDEDDLLVRISAVWCVKNFGESARPAIPALMRLIDDHDEPYLRLSAAGAISKIAPEVSEALSVIIEALTDPVPLHRAIACEFLGERRHKTAVLKTMTLLSDPEFTVRFAAAEAIGRTFNYWMHAVAVCVAMLKDGDETNRCVGAECLLSVGRYVKNDLDLLTMAMVDAPWDVRLDIEEVLDALRKQ
jgi:HEAT repeat protein